MTKDEEIKRKYDLKLQKCHAEKAAFMDQLEQALQERNVAVQERNLMIQERNALALQAQQEYERAERCVMCKCTISLKENILLNRVG